ncbi:MAG: aminoglycoside phosphotransferase [Frankiales bacterium]|nr:aminoglycoside phosphotransferase [Frankiales bacterium]
MPIPAQRDVEQTGAALAGWLARTLAADGDVVLGELRGPGATGFSNETLIVDASWSSAGEPRQASYVVRVAPTGYSLFPDAAFDTQYRVLRALSSTSVPVPTVRWYETDASVLGAPFFVMDEIRGRVPPDNPPYHMAGWLFDVSPEHRARLWWGAIDAMADLHGLDPRTCGLDFLTGGLGEGLAYYESFLESVEKDEQVPVARRALDWLRRHLPDEQPLGLTWGDARIGNVMYDDEGAVLAVLDWEMVGLGARAQDVAWALFLDRHHSEGCDVPRLEGFPSTAETVAHYEERTGTSLRDLDFYEVYSAFKFCVIMGRLAVIFKDWGLLPPDDGMAQDNTVTRLTERVLLERG